MNTTWKEKAIADYDDFIRNLSNSVEFQKEYLLELIKKNEDCEFGKYHDFKKIKTITDFQRRVPVRDYEEFSPWIKKIIEGNHNILTSEEVILLEPTGGTSSGSKLIPYTRSLKKEFQKGINVWLMNILKHKPGILNGLSYWSISPLNDKNIRSSGKIQVGFENDYDYLGWSKDEAKKMFAVPDDIKRIKDIHNFFYISAYFLLKSRDLSFISVWNPTFLTLLVDTIDKNLNNLVEDISEGTITINNPEDISYLSPYIKADKKRSNEIRKVFNGNERFIRVWPKLQMISSWGDATAKLYLDEIKNLFKGVYIQPKGLLATEGIITIPLIEAKRSVPAYMSHFLEFLPNCDQENPKLINDLEKNVEYSVIITTGGGLYRYHLKDKILVSDYWKQLPVIEFVGRNNTLDLVGEKLDEQFVSECINKVIHALNSGVKFILFAPEIKGSKTNYSLYLECKKGKGIEKEKFSNQLDKNLCKNYHYKYARDIGQLGNIEVQVISDGFKKYAERCHSEGQKLGDIKPLLIDKRSGWSHYFS